MKNLNKVIATIKLTLVGRRDFEKIASFSNKNVL